MHKMCTLKRQKRKTGRCKTTTHLAVFARIVSNICVSRSLHVPNGFRKLIALTVLCFNPRQYYFQSIMYT